MKNKLFKSKTDFESIIRPIIFLILGIIIFINPKEIITISLYAFSLALFIIGLFKILLYYKRPVDIKEVPTGLVYLLLGLVLAAFTFFAYDTVQIIFRFAIATLLIFTSVLRIVKSFKQSKKIKLLYLITSLILIILAIILMIFDFSIMTTGLFISLYSIIEIVGYIFNSKYTEESTRIPEANVLAEKEEQNPIEKIEQ